MRPSKLLGALLPAFAMAVNEIPDVSTTTVMMPVTTRTHTRIVFVTASAGPTVSTCLASLCAINDTSTGIISTIRLTSSTTLTTTKVVIPQESTATIDHATNSMDTSSCMMRLPSTITVTVTETSTPIITKSVYPVPASSVTNGSETQIFPNLSDASISSAVSVLPSAPYSNGSVTMTPASFSNTTVQYPPLHNSVPGTAPATSVHTTSVLVTSTATFNTFHGPTSKIIPEVYDGAAAGRLQPPRLFAVLLGLFAFDNLVKAHSSGPVVSTDLNEIQSRFYPYAAPLNSGPPPRSSVTPRDLPVVNTTTTNEVFETFITTSTVTFTMTQMKDTETAATPTSRMLGLPSESTTTSNLVLPSLLHIPNTSVTTSAMSATNITQSATTAFISLSSNHSDSASKLDSKSGMESEDSSLWRTSTQNITIFMTVAQPASSTLITATATVTTNVTNTVENLTTQTKTVSKTLSAFTDGLAPSAEGVLKEPNMYTNFVTLAMWILLITIS